MKKFLTVTLWILSFNALSQQPIFATIAGGDLYSFDLENCTRRFIGSTGYGFGDIAITSNGNLWGVINGQLYHIDTATANSTLVGNMGIYPVSLVDLNDTILLSEDNGNLYGINTNTASSYYIDTIGFWASGDLTWYDNDLYMVTGGGLTGSGVIKIVLNSSYTAILNATPLSQNPNVPTCEGAVTASFSCSYNSIVGFNGPNVIKFCQIDGSYETLCPNLNIGGTPGGASIRLPTQNPQPTSCPMSASISQSTQNLVICLGENYTRPNGAIVNTTGIYIDTLQNLHGCDSAIITTNLTVGSAHQITQNPVICANENYTLPNGTIVNITGIYRDTLQIVNSCDSIITINLTVNPTYHITQNAVICDNENYILPNGTIVNTTGVYTDTLQSVNGCDSIIVTHLTVNLKNEITQSTAICADETFALPGGTIADSTGIYIDTLRFISGCDSVIITTNLTVNPAYQFAQGAVICTNETYTLPNGKTINTSGIYADTMQTATGCDSIITTTVTANPAYQAIVFDTICPNQNYIRPNGSAVSATDIYTDTLQTINGCDSIITIDLTVYPNCDFYVPNTISPNGDDNNDYFSLFFTRTNFVKQFSVKIFNRWGEKIYESNDISFQWNGRYKENYVPSGAYVYDIVIVFSNNKIKTITGSLTVLR